MFFERGKRDEVIADFQQYYGISLPLPPEKMPDLERTGLLWSQLPAESRCMRAENSALEWDSATYLLWHIEFQLRSLMWSLGYDKKRPTPKPVPLPTPSQIVEARRKRDEALAAQDEIREILGLGDEDG